MQAAREESQRWTNAGSLLSSLQSSTNKAAVCRPNPGNPERHFGGWKAVEGLGEWGILAAGAKTEEQLEGESLARRTSCGSTAAQEQGHWLE